MLFLCSFQSKRGIVDQIWSALWGVLHSNINHMTSYDGAYLDLPDICQISAKLGRFFFGVIFGTNFTHNFGRSRYIHLAGLSFNAVIFRMSRCSARYRRNPVPRSCRGCHASQDRDLKMHEIVQVDCERFEIAIESIERIRWSRIYFSLTTHLWWYCRCE